MTTYRRITIPEVKAACDQIGLRLKPGVTYEDGACCPISALCIAKDFLVDENDDPIRLAEQIGLSYHYADAFIHGFDGWPTNGFGPLGTKKSEAIRWCGYSDGIAVRLALCPNEPLSHHPVDAAVLAAAIPQEEIRTWEV